MLQAGDHPFAPPNAPPGRQGAFPDHSGRRSTARAATRAHPSHPDSPTWTHASSARFFLPKTAPGAKELVEKNLKGLTSRSQPSPSSDTAHPLLQRVRPRSRAVRAARPRCAPVDGSRAGKGLGKWENLHSSQQRSPNRWLVAPQEAPRRAHPDRHVPREARPAVARSGRRPSQPGDGHSRCVLGCQHPHRVPCGSPTSLPREPKGAAQGSPLWLGEGYSG